MFKYAGVVLDYFDDKGATLKEKFPTVESVPSIIKEANVLPKEKLPMEAFALIANDSGIVMRKFACYDPGTTAMSVVYFMEHGDKLPEEAQKVAAANLVEACTRFGILPPKTLTKTAGKKTAMVDITGKSPKPIIKQASPKSDDDYAVKLADGSRHYPINSWDLVKKAEAYFGEEQIRMDPSIRRQYAKNLTKKAQAMGYPLHEEILEMGATEYASPGHLKASLEMRKVACAPHSEARTFLDEMLEKRSSMHPEVYAECLRRFDVQNGLDRGWGQVVLDPWASTFGMDKTAEVVWEDGADTVTDHDLENLALNKGHLVKKNFSQGLLSEFQKDPVGVFQSMPLPQKKVFARMSRDVVGTGESEGESVA
jgi:hypothetical protein